MFGLHFRCGILPIFQKVLRQESQGWMVESLTTISIPLTFFLAFGFGLKGHISNIQGLPYMVFVTPGLVTLTILSESYRTGAWGLWLDRWHQKMIDEYRIKPITTSDIIIGEILGGFTVALIKGSIVAMILLCLAPIQFNFWHIFPYLFYLFPGCILFTCIAAMIGTVFRKPDQIAQIQSIVITPLLYLGGLFFPITVFPQWTQPWLKLIPTTALFDGGRIAFLTGQINGNYEASLLISAVISFAAATFLFNKTLAQ